MLVLLSIFNSPRIRIGANETIVWTVTIILILFPRSVDHPLSPGVAFDNFQLIYYPW